MRCALGYDATCIRRAVGLNTGPCASNLDDLKEFYRTSRPRDSRSSASSTTHLVGIYLPTPTARRRVFYECRVQMAVRLQRSPVRIPERRFPGPWDAGSARGVRRRGGRPPLSREVTWTSHHRLGQTRKAASPGMPAFLL